MKKRIDLTLWHEGCWMLSLTRDFPDIELIVTDICSDSTDILASVLVTAEDEGQLEEIANTAAASAAVRATDVLDTGRGHLRVHTRYDVASSIYDAIVRSSLTPVGEIRIADNTEHWTVLADSGSIGTSIADLEQVADIEVRRVIDYEPDESTARDLVDQIRAELSPRQTRYLLSALEEGYYGWPRDVSAKELAAKHDVSGPTALEHLRKGEATVLREILETMRVREREPKATRPASDS